jgi:hypothetical protein
MSEIIAVVHTNQSSAFVKSQSDVQVAQVGIQGPSGPSAAGLRIDQLANVESSATPPGGSVLVYKTTTNKWTSTTTLDAQNMDGGEF